MPPENHDKLPKAFKSSNNGVAGEGQNQSDNQNDMILVKYHHIITNTAH